MVGVTHTHTHTHTQTTSHWPQSFRRLLRLINTLINTLNLPEQAERQRGSCSE
jgi:hypothetical protein